MTKRVFLVAFLLVCGLGLAAPAAPTQAQSSERCFDETGFCMSGPIRQYWERNGGLAVFGYPISIQALETVEGRSIQVQWFERDRLEIQADGLVTAGRLGVQRLEQIGINWQSLPGDTSTPAGCRFFRETQFNLCQPFLGYWERNGGLERFGYPVTRERSEILEGREYTVQYFERRRMEFHPENAGTPYEVLLGLLGREVRAFGQGPVIPACAANINPNLLEVYTLVSLGRPLGCPTLAPGNDVPAAIQVMERGSMIWFGQAEGPPMLVLNPRIFAIISPGVGLLFKTYADSWVEGRDPDQPSGVGTPPQPDLFPPWRGFGKVWSEDAELRQLIGWARESRARPERIDYQLFDSGILLVHLRNEGYTYAFGNPTNSGEVQFIPR